MRRERRGHREKLVHPGKAEKKEQVCTAAVGRTEDTASIVQAEEAESRKDRHGAGRENAEDGAGQLNRAQEPKNLRQEERGDPRNGKRGSKRTGRRRDIRNVRRRGGREEREKGEEKEERIPRKLTAEKNAENPMSQIPVFLPDPSYHAEYLEEIDRVLASGQYTNFGPREEAFRKKLEEVTGVPHCQPVSSGDMALYLGLLALREEAAEQGAEQREKEGERQREEQGAEQEPAQQKEPAGTQGTKAQRAGENPVDDSRENKVCWREPGSGRRPPLSGDAPQKEVITTPFTFPSTAEAILRAGYRPVFADVDPITLTLSPKSVLEKITAHTVGILPVHVYGTLCDTKALDKIAEEHHLFVVYDAAHAFGEERSGRSVLLEGTLSAISTHTTKTLHTVEGGCLFGRDPDLMERIRRMANFGLSGREGTPVSDIGCNAKMNELEAAIGLVNLSHYESGREKRALLDARYREKLRDLPGILLRPLQDGVKPNFSYFPIFVREDAGITRDALRAELRAQGILTRRYFYPLITESAAIRQAAGMPPLPEEEKERESVLLSETPIACIAASQVLCLPLYNTLPLEAVDAICDRIAAAIQEQSGEDKTGTG